MTKYGKAEEALAAPHPRESIHSDAVIIGSGPAGIAAAIRIKQLDPGASVVVMEKGSEVGAHILSGAVVDPVGIDKLLPGWREESDTPFETKVTDDHFYYFTDQSGSRVPHF